ncbi:MAG: hypothetical protein QGG24_05505 [Vicinamibacterales bacterium]|jgi:hypothetical protein|nr:hypothetical protein [Vicinamibacterales bacterium]MDP7472630.1 hypothetical protein [Vicinamibacterales bacterium]MDP7671995.1 hypothetical protein [Vicinamibacterales bacterium]HJO37211.1 hypothetical protein [Vicinamibacterales bacterium]|tara:strand:- start:222 stop:827 length:606 start_codon:yes stop_codon:yes gene_type:complete
MFFHSRRASGFVALLFAIASAGFVQSGETQEALVTSMAAKLADIVVHGSAPEERQAARETRASEAELRAFLLAGVTLPDGVTDPNLTLVGEGTAVAEAIVDLDRVRSRRSGSWTDPLSYLSGRLPVRASGVLHAENGVARVEIERVEVGGIGVPHLLLRELVAAYTRTDDQPAGLDLDDEYQLPYRVQEIRILAGEVVVVQ